LARVFIQADVRVYWSGKYVNASLGLLESVP
jgi:hypothetical protein